VPELIAMKSTRGYLFVLFNGMARHHTNLESQVRRDIPYALPHSAQLQIPDYRLSASIVFAMIILQDPLNRGAKNFPESVSYGPLHRG
jgi:hypothetical protein